MGKMRMNQDKSKSPKEPIAPQMLGSLMAKGSAPMPLEPATIYIEKEVYVDRPVYIESKVPFDNAEHQSLEHLASRSELALLQDSYNLLLEEINRIDDKFQPMGESMAESLQIALDLIADQKKVLDAQGRAMVGLRASSYENEASYKKDQKRQKYMNIGLGLLALASLISHLI